MARYLTVQDLAQRFGCTDKTVRRWIDEGKEIVDPFTNEHFLPGKDPGGSWIFKVAQAPREAEPLFRPRKVRRTLSGGVAEEN